LYVPVSISIATVSVFSSDAEASASSFDLFIAISPESILRFASGEFSPVLLFFCYEEYGCMAIYVNAK